MGELIERVNVNNASYGNSITQSFKENSLYFYNKYKQSDKLVKSISVGEMQLGGFYFLHYQDDSNWMKYSPIFTADFRKYEKLIIIYGVNFNFIPIEIRVVIFDKFITKRDFEKDSLLAVDFEGMYKTLIEYGFEYAIVEYNMEQVKLVHKISLTDVPKFLYSGHPINKYDPDKLYQIFKAKIKDKAARDQEMSQVLVKDFLVASDEINENYKLLKNHINRVSKSIEKYGRR